MSHINYYTQLESYNKWLQQPAGRKTRADLFKRVKGVGWSAKWQQSKTDDMKAFLHTKFMEHITPKNMKTVANIDFTLEHEYFSYTNVNKFIASTMKGHVITDYIQNQRDLAATGLTAIFNANRDHFTNHFGTRDIMNITFERVVGDKSYMFYHTLSPNGRKSGVPYQRIYKPNEHGLMITNYVNFLIDAFTKFLSEHAMQYATEFVGSSAAFNITLMHIPAPKKGAARKQYTTAEDILRHRCWPMDNTDSLCLFRSIVVAEPQAVIDALGEKVGALDSGRLAVDIELQTRLTLKLMSACGIPLGRADYSAVEAYVAGKFISRNIHIRDIGRRIVSDLDQCAFDDSVYLFFHDGHYSPIKDMKLFLCTSYYCKYCQNGSKEWKGRHDKCSLATVKRTKMMTPAKSCHKCYKTDCESLAPIPSDYYSETVCEKCKESFQYRSCFDNHHPTCGMVGDAVDAKQTCGNCGCPSYQHIKGKPCHHRKCHLCNDTHDLGFGSDDSQCRITQQKPKPPVTKFIVFDFETAQDRTEEARHARHVVDLAVAIRFEVDDEVDALAPINQYKHVSRYDGQNIERVLDGFCEWMLSADHIGYTVIAHNGRGYDFQFVLDYITRTSGKYKVQTVMNGSKIMQMKVFVHAPTRMSDDPFSKKPIRFIDSLNHITSSLKGFTKMFGLKSAKGDFPHMFNKLGNWNYSGGFPDLVNFCVEEKTPADKAALLSWYYAAKTEYEREGKAYVMREELEKYCEEDCQVLMQGVLAYRHSTHQIVKETNPATTFDPWNYTTAASTAMAIFRTECMPKDIPLYSDDNGYQAFTRYCANVRRHHRYRLAVEGCTWDRSAQPHNTAGLRIARPLELGGRCYKVFQEEGSFIQQRVEFVLLSCHFHGCKRCNANNSDKSPAFTGKSYEALLNHTVKMTSPEENDGVKIVCTFECEYKEELNDARARWNFQIGNQTIDLDHTAITRNEMLYGGRTAPCVLYSKGRAKEYQDIVSMYPFVLFSKSIPIGIPYVFTYRPSDDDDKQPLHTPITRWSPEMLTREILDPVATDDFPHFVSHVVNGGEPKAFTAGSRSFAYFGDVEAKYQAEAKDTPRFRIQSFADFVRKQFPEFTVETGAVLADLYNEGGDYLVMRDESNFARPFVVIRQSIDDAIEAYNSYARHIVKTTEGRCFPHMHEVLRRDLPQRVRFDLDFKTPDMETGVNLIEAITDACLIVATQKQAEYNKKQGIADSDNELDTESFVDKIQITSSCSDTKTSFHVITPVYGYVDECRAFADEVHKIIRQTDGAHAVDTGVHKSTQNFRMPYSSKAADPARSKRFFAIRGRREYDGLANINAARIKSLLVGEYEFDTRDIQGVVRLSCDSQKKNTHVVKSIDLNPAYLAILRKEIPDFDKTWKFRTMHNNLISFYRLCASHCRVCNRTHESDNTLFVTFTPDGTLFERCHHKKRDGFVRLGSVNDGADKKGVAAKIKITLTPVDPAIRFNLFDISTGRLHAVDPAFARYAFTKHPHQFKVVDLEMTKALAEYYERFYRRDWNSAESLVTCKVLVTPPDNMLHPILPRKDHGKVIFDLTQRVGTYTHPELKAALERGYRIDHVYEVHYHTQSSTEVFKPYIRLFFKAKDMASDISAAVCSTVDGKTVIDEIKLNKYCDDYERNYGIIFTEANRKLIRDTLGKGNAGLRSVAKIFLNSLWGKFGENLDKQQIAFVNNYDDLASILFSSTTDGDSLEYGPVNPDGQKRTPTGEPGEYTIDDGTFMVRYRKLLDDNTTSNYTNMYVASYTTSNARVYLHSFLEKLGDRVVYYDTDSIFYYRSDNPAENIPYGDAMGEWKSELDNGASTKPEDVVSITEWASQGPKSYAYKTNNSEAKMIKTLKGYQMDRIVMRHRNRYYSVASVDGKRTCVSFDTRDAVRAHLIGFIEEHKLVAAMAEIDSGKFLCEVSGVRFFTFLPAPDYCMKNKGIFINTLNSSTISYDNFVDCVYNTYFREDKKAAAPTLHTPVGTRIERKHRQLYTDFSFRKIVQCTYDKSLILIDRKSQIVRTAPFGYRRDLIEALVPGIAACDIIDPRYESFYRGNKEEC